MAIKKGDFIEITYTGTIAETGAIFDTTDEKLAADAGLTHHAHFGPQTICVGERHVLPGLDDNLDGAEIGTHTWKLPCEKAFGKKDPQLIQLIPLSQFKKQKIQPIVGLQLNIDGQIGTIKVASGGRVLVDFNHPLAGKDLAYTITINRIVVEPKAKLKAILDMILHTHQEVPIAVTGDSATIELPSELSEETAKPLREHLSKLTGIKTITFTTPQKKESSSSSASGGEKKIAGEIVGAKK